MGRRICITCMKLPEWTNWGERLTSSTRTVLCLATVAEMIPFCVFIIMPSWAAKMRDGIYREQTRVRFVNETFKRKDHDGGGQDR